MLRARLFLNWIPFVVVLVGVGVYASVVISRLLNNLDVTLTQNYQSATAAHSMVATLKDMERTLNLVVDGDKVSGASWFNAHSKKFEADLAVLVKNVPLFGKTNLVGELQTNYHNLQREALTILRLSKPQDQRPILTGKVAGLLVAINRLLEQIGDINHRNILDTTANIQGITRHVRRVITVAMIVVVVISILASWQFGRSVLRPIQLLTRATRAVGEGNIDQTVPILSHDELGELAVAFNTMAVQLKAYRQSTTEKIMRLHRTMASAIASFPDPIFVLDRAGQIEMKNPAAETLAGQLALKGVLPNHLPETARQVLRTGNDFLPHSFTEVLTLRVGGEERAYLPRILTMRGPTQDPVGVAVVLHDVTRFRLLDDVKTNLLATVSHELKTPLTSVRMALHLLLEKNTGALTRKQAGLVETARLDAERLLRILNDLLDLTRLEAGHSGLQTDLFAPAELVQLICEEARQNVAANKLTLVRSVAPGLPLVRVDRQRIGHVFHNFITNAVRHSPPDGKIEVCAGRSEDGGVQFSVKDQGPGVPMEYDQRIFDRFFRVPGQTRSGAGLGLSIAREIVLAHGGRIGVHSEPGKGSEFYFVLAGAEEAAPVQS